MLPESVIRTRAKNIRVRAHGPVLRPVHFYSGDQVRCKPRLTRQRNRMLRSEEGARRPDGDRFCKRLPRTVPDLHDAARP